MAVVFSRDLPMGLFSKRVQLSSPLSVEEVQARLAAKTADWNRGIWGRAVPPPPWEPNAGFVACFPSFNSPLVVVGDVQSKGQGSELTASIRPHGVQIAPLMLFCATLPIVALQGAVAAAGGLFIVPLVGAFFLWVNVAVRSPAILDVLAAACDADPPRPATPPAR